MKFARSIEIKHRAFSALRAQCVIRRCGILLSPSVAFALSPRDGNGHKKSHVHFLQDVAPFVRPDLVLIITRNYFSELFVFLRKPQTLLSHASFFKKLASD